jgi:phosphopantothenoylcysteine decarboxylase / phosphopantothenate---cysteine ligase
MARLADKRVLLGVGGSIAAYRACDVIRRLRELGIAVRVAPTRAACAFVTPLTFEALSGQRVLGGVLEVEDGKIPHIEEAYAADVAVVAPATADLLAKMVHGVADEALLATLLSVRAPLIVAPAMETRMWDHPATQQNVRTLEQRGVHFVGPVAGALASGRDGRGRLAPVDDIVEFVLAALEDHDLQGMRVLVTAGPTAEDVDPVRYLTNRSSGKMGVAIARAAAQRGAHVQLVHGPLRVNVPNTPGLVPVPVRSARAMYEAVHARIADTDVAILSAAVADARPARVSPKKLKKGEDKLTSIALEPTDDILVSLGKAHADRVTLVGFAAETHDVERYARDKRARKNCAIVVANDVSEPGSGFDVDTNRVYLAKASGSAWLAPMTKERVAHALLDDIKALRAPARKRTAAKNKRGTR